MVEDLQRHHLGSLLRWYAAMGADEAVGDRAVDWLVRGDAQPGGDFSITALAGRQIGRGQDAAGASGANAEAVRATASPRSVAAFADPDEAIMSARTQAAGARSLQELGEILGRFEGCGLRKTAKNLCFFRGSETSDIMIIGEAPGRDEDLAGRPFVGRAGQLLDKMLAAIGLDEASVHITNVVYWRPPGNRTPSVQETQVCRPFLDRQVALVNPKIVVLLGGAAAKTIYNTSDGIMRLRGKWREADFGDTKVKALATLHPAFLLRSPGHKRLAWRDLLAIRAQEASS